MKLALLLVALVATTYAAPVVELHFNHLKTGSNDAIEADVEVKTGNKVYMGEVDAVIPHDNKDTEVDLPADLPAAKSDDYGYYNPEEVEEDYYYGDSSDSSKSDKDHDGKHGEHDHEKHSFLQKARHWFHHLPFAARVAVATGATFLLCVGVLVLYLFFKQLCCAPRTQTIEYTKLEFEDMPTIQKPPKFV